MSDDEVRVMHRTLYDIYLTMEALLCIVTIKPESSLSNEDARRFFDRFWDRMDSETRELIDEYCEVIGDSLRDKEKGSRAEFTYNAIAQHLRLARAQLLQRVGEWREVKKEVPTTNALF